MAQDMDSTETMSDLDVIRRQAAENEGMADTASWAEIFKHFRTRILCTVEELSDVAGVSVDTIRTLEVGAMNVDARTRQLVWDTLCFIEGGM